MSAEDYCRGLDLRSIARVHRSESFTDFPFHVVSTSKALKKTRDTLE